MRRQSIPVAILCVLCFLAGMLTNQYVPASAQGPSQPESGIRALQPPTRAQHGKALYFPLDEIKKKFAAAPQTELTATHLAWDPSYRFTVMTRAYYDPPRLGRVSQATINWDDAEMHENKTQIYIMVGGAGSLALGGEPERQRTSPDGQHSGGPLKGASLQRVNAGDWVVIPPYTWHQAQPDKGQTMVYGMCHVETRNLMP